MPLVVDHEQRRAELVAVTWRVIAREGYEKATMRQICAAAGFSNGALKPYFPTKESLLEATFDYVFAQTLSRVNTELEGHRGFAAIEVFAKHVMPLDELGLDEARVVVPFWQKALHDSEEQAHHRQKMAEWHELLKHWLIEENLPVQEAGLFAQTLLTFLLGTQITSVMGQEESSPPDLLRQLESHLDLIRSWRDRHN